MIQVCLPDEACDENVLGDTDVGVMFVSEHKSLQMTTMCWLLSHMRLEGGRLLSDIVMLCSEVAQMDSMDCAGLQGIPRNPYRSVRRKILSRDQPHVSKLKFKTSEDEVRKVSSQRCCKYRCCQTFPWESTRILRRKFYSCSFEIRRETAYAVQRQLHIRAPEGRKFMTLEADDFGENAWYIIHGVSRSAHHVYKAAAVGGCVSGSHGNSGSLRPRPHTIQARATLQKIIDENADQMPNEFLACWK
jgi:hypothetical protein